MRKPPRWSQVLLRWLAPGGQADDVIGDLEEAHEIRLRRHRQLGARALTALETLDMAFALLRARAAARRDHREKGIVQDYKLGLRMLTKYPGLTIAGGLALAIAIGIGAGWYDLSHDLLRPKIPLPDGDRIVEVEMRNPMAPGDERRLLHDFLLWRQHLRLVENLGAYRTIERNLALDGSARPERVTVAEISAAAFELTRVPPLFGRPLLESDERPGAPPVVVLGYDVWRRQFDGAPDAIGRTVQLGQVATTVVGVMPQGYAFPVNHRLWIPLQLRGAYAPLEGAPIRVFGRTAAGATQAQLNVEVAALTERVAAASPKTHRHLRPRVLAYGGESSGDRTLLEVVITHLPILLVLTVACANVGTLIYARTATREAEIAMRYALGASRSRIVTQLFVEALVLTSVAAVVGLVAADWALKTGMSAFFSGQHDAMPFWVNPGLKLTTVLFASVLTVIASALLSVLPALKATGSHAQTQLRNLGSGGSSLRFGWVWTSVMIAQVALGVICIPPAMGISHEALRDRRIRDQFPAERYLAVQLDLREELSTLVNEPEEMRDARLERVYRELERRVAEEPQVVAVTFADRLPGMGVAVRPAEAETSEGSEPVLMPNLWTASVGQGFFEAFDVPIVTGRDFHDGDRVADARTAVVNEAFVRRYMNGANPVGRRVRFTSSRPEVPEPWLEIVGMVRDIGMTPTDRGEAPYLFRPASPATTFALVMGVHVSGDPSALAPRVRAIAAELDLAVRLDDVRPLDDLVWRQDIPMMVAAAAIAAVVSLGLFLSAAGIFSLMSVSVARRTREIGLRIALGATPMRVIGHVFFRALVLVGTGVAAGNAVLLLLVALSPEIALREVGDALATTSVIMLSVGLLACVEPARRALRIHPTDALKEA